MMVSRFMGYRFKSMVETRRALVQQVPEISVGYDETFEMMLLEMLMRQIAYFVGLTWKDIHSC